MKISQPKSKFNLHIKRNDYVLEVGSGHSPHKRANVIVDKYIKNNKHRSGDISKYKHQTFILADGEKLPFKDKEFDYVICTHVLEHVDNPTFFLQELSRVARKGYIETPSLPGEYLIPKKSHKWITVEIDNKIILFDKQIVSFIPPIDIGDIFIKHLFQNSIGFKILKLTHPNLFTLRHEWIDKIDFMINPQIEEYKSLFKEKWDESVINYFTPKRTKSSEIFTTIKAILYLLKSHIKLPFRQLPQKISK